MQSNQTIITNNVYLPNINPAINLITGNEINPITIERISIKIQKVMDNMGNVFGVIDLPYLIYINREKEPPKITINGVPLEFQDYIDTINYSVTPSTSGYVLSNCCKYKPTELYKQANLGTVDLANYPNLIWLHEEWTNNEDNIAVIENFDTYFELNTFSNLGYNELETQYTLGDIKFSFMDKEILEEDGWVHLFEGREIYKSKYTDLYNYLCTVDHPFQIFEDKIVITQVEKFLGSTNDPAMVGTIESNSYMKHTHDVPIEKHTHTIRIPDHNSDTFEGANISVNVENSPSTVVVANGEQETSDTTNSYKITHEMTIKSLESGNSNDYVPKGHGLPTYIYSKNVDIENPIEEPDISFIPTGTIMFQDFDYENLGNQEKPISFIFEPKDKEYSKIYDMFDNEE